MLSSRRSARRFAASACRARSSRTRSRQRVGEAPREQLASGWGYFLGDAAIVDQLCFGPPQGQKVTFVHPEDWLGTQPSFEPDAALRDVARRYLAAYGPATHREFRQWFTSRSFGLEAAEAVFAELDLVEVDVDGHAAYLLEDEKPMPRASSVRLLPEYDVYVMGFRERDELVPPEVREQVAAHGKGRYEGPAGTPFLLIDGLCAGIWSRKKGAKKIELTVEPARNLTHDGDGRRGSRGGTSRLVPRPRGGIDDRLRPDLGALLH